MAIVEIRSRREPSDDVIGGIDGVEPSDSLKNFDVLICSVSIETAQSWPNIRENLPPSIGWILCLHLPGVFSPEGIARPSGRGLEAEPR